MSVAQWISDLGIGVAPSGLRGFYSPVPAAPTLGRKRAGYLGTPEIFFAKSIDNSRLVKADDPQRKREMRVFTASVICFFALLMVYALQHFSSIEYGYKIEAQKRLRDELIESNRALKLEEASLRDPERIDVLARKMGLQAPVPGQVQRIESSSDSAEPAMARLQNVSVVVAQ
jgi:cell division protein FtsL